MYLSVLLKLIGGLAMFIYGMYAMGEALTELAGGKIERTLARLTSGKVKAMLLGVSVTAVVQSSSVVTVMTAGLVSSGMMTFAQSVGVIMGANIGTTVTSWLLCLADIEGTNIWLKMLMPSTFVPVLGITGIMLILVPKSRTKRNVGNVISGFTTLMTGMDIMSAATSPLAASDSFNNILVMFEQPLAGILAGALVTAVLQSSSASIGILQALCINNNVSYACVIPIIMGQNIGTCITALLAAVGSTREAGRTVRLHLLFNLTGTAVFTTLFYTVNMIYGFSFIHYNAGPEGIALIHTIFNLGTALILLPCIRT